MAFNHSWQAVFKPGASDDFFTADHPIAFHVNADGFNPVNAWWLSELSRLIYRKDASEGVDIPGYASRSDFLARVGLVERQFFSSANIQGALVETMDTSDEAFAALVFRGTTGRLSNWLFNLNMVPCAWPAGGKVHRGFKTILMALWDTIDATLNTVKKPLFYTGHSLGGALATLAATLRPPRAVYTFGAPRMGDATFAETLAHVPVFNVFNPRDIVTELPPAGHWTRFTHAGAIVKNTEFYLPHRIFSQAPSFLAGHAPLNYTAQLPVAFDN
ncbi:MAG: lipase family protein [Desulfosarcina sp.]|nr:lipase family protein [Desulfosarcina sp.]MBC2744324.1 lipase family protein [Desulfosarcina sp.]MBC2767233.1 lipase family protein [Desulfosarcina sp.]